MTSNVFEMNNLRLAVLIDAENVPRNCIKSVMKEIAIYGTPTIKRIYGDWTNPSVSGWKGSLLENAITPIQQYSYTTGKNSSDSAMIIDAMDILYTGKTDGFVLVSSDSDFTRLAVRLREAGQRVIGIGERKTPGAFIAACDRFIYIEVIRQNEAAQHELAEETAAEAPAERAQKQTNKAAKPAPAAQTKPAPQKQKQTARVPEDTVRMIADSVADIAGDNEWVFMGELGNLILKTQPDFDPRNYGFKSLSAMIKSIPRFEVDFRQSADPNIKHPYVRDREN